MTAEKWIGPTVESEIDALAETGAKDVLLIPVGFVSDHVEILYDIDVALSRLREGQRRQRAADRNL